MRPVSGVSASRSSMSWSRLCFSLQAVVCVTPNRRAHSRDEIPVLLWVRWYMAWNHTTSANLLAWKIVPAVREV